MRPVPLRSTFGMLLLLGALVVFGAPSQGDGGRGLLDPQAAPRGAAPADPAPVLAALDAATEALFERAHTGVVHIRTTAVSHNPFTRQATEYLAGEGTGFVWDEQGHVVTNYHVIRGARRAFVQLAGEDESRPARLVGYDDRHDIAVLAIEPPEGGLTPLPLGSSADLRVGQHVFAIGNPFGYDQTLTSGVISALDRVITSVAGNPIHGVIQTDAAINRGNSGGPLLDTSGRVIGMNTMIFSPTGTSLGIGFAVPVDTIDRVVPTILRTGQGPRASLGISAASDSWARRHGVEGVVVVEVAPGGPAAVAGVEPVSVDEHGAVRLGDVVVGLGGRPVRSRADLASELAGRTPGEVVDLEVLRDGRPLTLRVRLGSGE